MCFWTRQLPLGTGHCHRVVILTVMYVIFNYGDISDRRLIICRQTVTQTKWASDMTHQMTCNITASLCSQVLSIINSCTRPLVSVLSRVWRTIVTYINISTWPSSLKVPRPSLRHSFSRCVYRISICIQLFGQGIFRELDVYNRRYRQNPCVLFRLFWFWIHGRFA